MKYRRLSFKSRNPFLSARKSASPFSSMTLSVTLHSVIAAGIWLSGSLMSSAAPLLSPADRVIGMDLDSASGFPGGESPAHSIDGNSGSKYLNFNKLNAGIIVTPTAAATAQSLVLTTANDAIERDPSSYILFGSNSPITSTNNSSGFNDHWTFISSGTMSLPTDRGVTASPINIPNTASFSSYWLVFTSTRDNVGNNLMQIAEIQLFTEPDGTGSPIFTPGDPTVATGWNSSWPSAGEAPSKVVDRTTSKYLNFGKQNSGFIVIPAAGATIVDSFVITTGGDAEGRDPASYTLHGQDKDGLWTQISSGPLSLTANRNAPSAAIPVVNANAYVAYRMVFPTVKNTGENSMQVSEVQFYGTILPANDTDSDAMDDTWETQYGLIVGTDDSAGDIDSDGSNNLDEYRRVTLPNNPDTDGDGYFDGAETLTGIWVSNSNTGTDPLKLDTDGDGYGDKYEANNGTDPNSAAATPTVAWDITPGTVGAGDTAITGGAGTWDLSSGNWTIDGGANNLAWNNSGPRLVAVFGGATGGAVPLDTSITADGLIFNTTGYSITGNNLTLGGPKPTITTAPGVTTEISSPLVGTAGLTKNGSGVLILTGTGNSLTGTFTLGGDGKIVLAKSDGIAIGGNINLSSTRWNGNNAGVVLGADEQIADTSILTWTTTGQADTFFRPNGHTETIGGLVSSGESGFVVIENRGYQDTADYATGTVIINAVGTNTYSYNGNTRDRDGGTGGGAIALTKTGTGTQILSGGGLTHSGPTIINGGMLQLDGNLSNSPVTVTATGTLSGTGRVGSTLTVQNGGTVSPGIAGVGTLTSNGLVTLATGGTLTGAGTLTGSVTIANGGVLASTGSVSGTITTQTGGTLAGTPTLSGAVLVQAGGTLAPAGSGIGNVTATTAVTLAGNCNFDIHKSGGTLSSDTLSGFANITYGGTLAVSATGDSLTLGDTFQLFVPAESAAIGGGFTNLVLPSLPIGLSWDTSGLLTTGSISIVNFTGPPSFSPAPGGYVGPLSVTINSDTGSTIYYTTNGTPPTPLSPSGISPVSGIVIPLGSVVNLQAYASMPGLANSPLVSGVYRTVATATWMVDDNGNWSDPLNWLNEVSPNNSGAPVDFTSPQGAETTVTLDGSKTVGSMTFGNANGYNWNIVPQGASTLTLAGSTTPTIAVLDNTTTINAGLAGLQGLAKTGPGALVLNGLSTYSGTTAINGGVLSIGSLNPNGVSSGIGSGTALSMNGGTLRYTGGSVGYGNFGRTIELGENGGTLDFVNGGYWFTTGVTSGSGSLTKTGVGQLIVEVTNTYDGVTYLNQGEIQLRNLSGLGSTVGNTVVANDARLCAGGNLTGIIAENLELNGNGGNGSGALQANDGTNVTYSGNITLASDSGVGSTGGIAFTISGPISGPGGLIKLNNNVVTLTGGASNTYAGATTLTDVGKLVLAKTGGAIAIPGNVNLSSSAWNGDNSGLVLEGDEQIADAAVLTWTDTAYGGGAKSASFLRLHGHTETVGGLSSAPGGDAEIENRGYQDNAAYGNSTLIINTTGSNSYTFSGGIRDMDGGTGGGTIALVKMGTGTQVFNGGLANSGPTTVNGGTLQIDAVSSSTATTVATGGTLKGNGATIGTLAIQTGGTLAPGITVGNFGAGSTTIAGTLACEIDGVTADRFTANGSLDLTGATLALTALNAPTADSYVLASYTTDLTGTFASITGLPTGYAVQYDSTAKQVKLVKSGYDAWAAAQGLVAGVNDGKAMDPDADGASNVLEFALGGNPLSGTNRGTSKAGIQTVDSAPALTLTIAVRTGAVFAAGTANSQEAVVDGIKYRIESAADLTNWNGVISEIAPLTQGLPAAPTGYVYHTFRTAGPVVGTPTDFIRLRVTEQP